MNTIITITTTAPSILPIKGLSGVGVAETVWAPTEATCKAAIKQAIVVKANFFNFNTGDCLFCGVLIIFGSNPYR